MSVQYLSPVVSTHLPYANGWVYRLCGGCLLGGMEILRKILNYAFPCRLMPVQGGTVSHAL